MNTQIEQLPLDVVPDRIQVTPKKHNIGALIALVGAGIALMSFFFLTLIDLSDIAGRRVEATGVYWSLDALRINNTNEAFASRDLGPDFGMGGSENIDLHHAALVFIPIAAVMAALAGFQALTNDDRSSADLWFVTAGSGIIGLLYLGYLYFDIDNILGLSESLGIKGTDLIGPGFWALLVGTAVIISGAIISGLQRQAPTYQSEYIISVKPFTTLAPLWTLVALGIFFSMASLNFARTNNLNNILVQISTLAIFGTGMTFILLTGQIDLSIAALAGLSGMLAAYVYTNMDPGSIQFLEDLHIRYDTYHEILPILAGLGAATLLGLASGIASTWFRIPTFMSTLAMSMIAGGLNTYVSKGRTITTLPEISIFLGSKRVGGPDGIRIIIAVAAVSLLIGYIILRYTRFGRYVYMTGANMPGARLVGVNTHMVIIVTLTFSGFMAGLAGIVSMGRLGSAQPDAIPSYLIDTIGAVVLGGTALTGGRGGIPQTVIGLLIYGTLRNGLDGMPSIDVYLKEFITGVVLVAALVVNIVFSGKQARDKTT